MDSEQAEKVLMEVGQFDTSYLQKAVGRLGQWLNSVG